MPSRRNRATTTPMKRRKNNGKPPKTRGEGATDASAMALRPPNKKTGRASKTTALSAAWPLTARSGIDPAEYRRMLDAAFRVFARMSRPKVRDLH